MWEFEFDDDIDRRLRETTGDGLFLPGDLPQVLIRAAFNEPLWLMKGRVQQWWRSAEYHGHDLGPQIAVAINDSTAVNAYALPDERGPIITLSAGACIRLRQLMHLVTWNMKDFPTQGSEGELPNGRLLSSSLNPQLAEDILVPIDLSAGQDEMRYLELLLPVAPSEKRGYLANVLTLAAFDFMVMHEISHIVRGHARFLGSVPNFFFEGGSAQAYGPIPGDKLALRRLLELDADLSATATSAAQFAGLGEIIPAWRRWTDNTTEVQDLWLTSLALLFSFFDAWSIKSEFHEPTHPPVGVRLLSIASVLFDELAEGFPTVDNPTGGMTEEGLGLAWRVYSALERAARAWEVADLPEVSARLITGKAGFEPLMSKFGSYRTDLIESGLRKSVDM